jgi:hypothetical protein
MDSAKLLFHERQRFTQWWIWLPLFGFLAFFLWGAVQQLIQGEPWGDNPMSNLGLLLFGLLPLAFIGFFRIIELETRITEEEIHVILFPIAQLKFKWERIEKAEIISYGFVGYGLRLGSRYGTVYNIKGNKGLLLKLKNERKFLIGTQQPEVLQQVLEQLGSC